MTDLELLKRVVIAFDADQDEEFQEALVAARARCGLVLAEDADDVLTALQTKHVDDADLDDQQRENHE